MMQENVILRNQLAIELESKCSLPQTQPRKPSGNDNNSLPVKEDPTAHNTCAQEALLLGAEALHKLSPHASDAANATLWQCLAQAYSLVVDKDDTVQEDDDEDEKK